MNAQLRPGRSRRAAQAPHVCIIVANLPVPLDRRVWLECQTLISAGYRVSVICPKGDGDPEYEEIDGVCLHKYMPARPAAGVVGYAREFSYSWVQSARLLRRVHRHRPISVIQACNPPDTFWALARLYRRRGVQFVYDQHDLCPEIYESRCGQGSATVRRTLLWLERQAYRSASHVIATNESYRDIALGRGRVPPQRISIVRSGPDVERMRPGPPDPALRRGAAYLCVYLGIMGEQDRVDIAVRAADVLVNLRGRSDIHFAMLGFGDTLESLRALAQEKGLDRYMTFTGRADHNTITAYLSTADVGLAPDPKTSFNDKSTHNKVLEYMAYKVPVLAFDLTESVRSASGAGVFVPGRGTGDDSEVVAFANAIERLLVDEVGRRRMGAVGRRRIEENLGWHVSRREYQEVYDALRDGRVPAGVAPRPAVPEVPTGVPAALRRRVPTR